MTSAGELRWIHAPQQVRSQATLDRILLAAEALVAEKGFEDSSIAEIVRRAGSSVGAFYARFPDKHALLHALSARFVEQAMATADVALDPKRWEGSSIARIVGSVIPFLVEIYRQQSGILRAFVVRNHTDPEFRERQDRLTHYVDERLCELLLARAGEIRHPRPEAAIRFGLVLVFGALQDAILFGELDSRGLHLSDDTFSAELTRAYLAYLGIESATTRHEEKP